MNIEIRDQQRAIDLLRCSINEKEFAMKIAQTRLDERTRRLCVEVCFDEPMKGSVYPSVCHCDVCLSVQIVCMLVFVSYFFTVSVKRSVRLSLLARDAASYKLPLLSVSLWLCLSVLLSITVVTS